MVLRGNICEKMKEEEGLSVDEAGPKSGTSSAVLSLGQSSKSPWDPLASPDWDAQKQSPHCLQRIQRDLSSLFKDPPPGIFVVPDEHNLTLLHALIVGPYETPYEGGFFYFRIRCPPDYPIRAPRIRLMTTGGDTVRFNPNLYRNGKVCLSILGTWSGPSWTPAQSISSVLLSIQSLMNEKPYHNEPGFEKEHAVGDSERYNQIIVHETLRVAVCGMLDSSSCPESLKQMMQALFHASYEHYVEACGRLEQLGLQGTRMLDPFGERRGLFDPAGLRAQLEAFRASIPNNEGEETPIDSL